MRLKGYTISPNSIWITVSGMFQKCHWLPV